MKLVKTFLLVSAMMLSVGCDQQKVADQGFALPPGDVEEGQLVFINYRCIECHTLAGTEFVGDDWGYNEQRAINVEIGGEVTKMQTYGDLVTAIINPSHRIAEGYEKTAVQNSDGESRMRVYNDVMTVTELINLVTFLKSEYELISPPLVIFPDYTYPE
jgi:hypothetical protein